MPHEIRSRMLAIYRATLDTIWQQIPAPHTLGFSYVDSPATTKWEDSLQLR